MMRKMLLIALVAGGCWSTKTAGQGPSTTLVPPEQEQPPPETNISWQPRHKQSPCDLAMARAFETARDELEKVSTLKGRLDEVRDAAAESCKATQWSQETLDCFSNAPNGNEVIRCASHLNSDQNSDMQRRMNDIFNKPNPTPPPPPPMP